MTRGIPYHAILAAIIVAVPVFGQERPPAVYLPFDSDFNDHGAYGFAVTNHGDEVRLDDGVVGSGVFIGGTGDWIDVSVDSRLSLTNGATLECWFAREDWENPYRGGSGWQTVAHIDGLTVNITAPGCRSHPPWLLDASAGWKFGTATNVAPVLIRVKDKTIKPLIWHHVALVHDPKANRTDVYLDGIKVASKPAAPPLAVKFVNPFRLGTWFKADQAFRGYIDEVMIFDYPRSDSQINASSNRRSRKRPF